MSASRVGNPTSTEGDHFVELRARRAFHRELDEQAERDLLAMKEVVGRAQHREAVVYRVGNGEPGRLEP